MLFPALKLSCRAHMIVNTSITYGHTQGKQGMSRKKVEKSYLVVKTQELIEQSLNKPDGETVEDMAYHTGVCVSTIRKIRKDIAKNPSVNHICAIFEYLTGARLETLLND
jgi:transcriptional regulator with XRE-family HTH domain